jgi:hypothetical protein
MDILGDLLEPVEALDSTNDEADTWNPERRPAMIME